MWRTSSVINNMVGTLERAILQSKGTLYPCYTVLVGMVAAFGCEMLSIVSKALPLWAVGVASQLGCGGSSDGFQGSSSGLQPSGFNDPGFSFRLQ